MSYRSLAIGALGALGVMTGAESVRALTLAELVGSGPITSGGVVYSNFTVGGNLPADQVHVNFTPEGVQFTANWNTLKPGNDSSVIGYDLAVNPAVGGTLTSSGLFFAGQVVVNNATTTVTETLTDMSTGKNYGMKVYYDGPGGLSDNLTDNVTFNPAVTSLHVIKNINVSAGFGAYANLNFVENTFMGIPGGGVTPPIPEPMSLALLPLALAGLGLRKKFSRS